MILTFSLTLNLYTARSIAKLMESAGLESVKAVFLDLGWIKTTNIRALARKPGSVYALPPTFVV